jgi:hypothetical protein
LFNVSYTMQQRIKELNEKNKESEM